MCMYIFSQPASELNFYSHGMLFFIIIFIVFLIFRTKAVLLTVKVTFLESNVLLLSFIDSFNNNGY